MMADQSRLGIARDMRGLRCLRTPAHPDINPRPDKDALHRWDRARNYCQYRALGEGHDARPLSCLVHPASRKTVLFFVLFLLSARDQPVGCDHVIARERLGWVRRPGPGTRLSGTWVLELAGAAVMLYFSFSERCGANVELDRQPFNERGPEVV
jgi:hypothetical protein